MKKEKIKEYIKNNLRGLTDVEKIYLDKILEENKDKIENAENNELVFYAGDIPTKIKTALARRGIMTKFSNSGKMYKIDFIKEFVEVYDSMSDTNCLNCSTDGQNQLNFNIPDDLFDIILKHDDIKAFIKMVLKADEPVHVLLIGPPGTAKSLFLMELERLGGYFTTGGSTTKVGLRDLLFDRMPKLLLIDEIDKIENGADLSALLTWAESGRVVMTKHNIHEERKGKGIIVAAGNDDSKLPPELKDRFEVFYLKPYTKDEFKEIAENYLVKRMNKDKELAKYIAEKVSEYSNSIREVIRIARLAKSKEDVDVLLRIISKYHGP